VPLLAASAPSPRALAQALPRLLAVLLLAPLALAGRPRAVLRRPRCAAAACRCSLCVPPEASLQGPPPGSLVPRWVAAQGWRLQVKGQRDMVTALLASGFVVTRPAAASSCGLFSTMAVQAAAGQHGASCMHTSCTAEVHWYSSLRAAQLVCQTQGTQGCTLRRSCAGPAPTPHQSSHNCHMYKQCLYCLYRCITAHTCEWPHVAPCPHLDPC
jgi:hypothetical protein